MLVRPGGGQAAACSAFCFYLFGVYQASSVTERLRQADGGKGRRDITAPPGDTGRHGGTSLVSTNPRASFRASPRTPSRLSELALLEASPSPDFSPGQGQPLGQWLSVRGDPLGAPQQGHVSRDISDWRAWWVGLLNPPQGTGQPRAERDPVPKAQSAEAQKPLCGITNSQQFLGSEG